MAEAQNDIPIDRKLSEIFNEGYNLYRSLETTKNLPNSPEFQRDVKKCTSLLEDSTRLVSLSGLFSTNESADEIASDDLRYFLLPYFLGKLTQKVCTPHRLNLIDISEIYFKDFLKRCIDYELYKPTRSVIRSTGDRPSANELVELQQMAVDRNAKLERYRQQKAFEEELAKLKILMDDENIEDEIKRNYYLQMIQSVIMECEDELVSLAQEKLLCEHIEQLRKTDPDFGKRPEKPTHVNPLKPIIITKDVFQKAVYGLGYPSRPTMTVEEFYEDRVRHGIFPDPEKSKGKSMQGMTMQSEEDKEKEEVDLELKVENDDPEELARARAKDDYKDEVRRGDGNRHNRS